MSSPAVSSFVPYLHVANVQDSIEFYGLFGLSLDSRFGPEGAPFWARMKAPGCDLMLARASGPVDPTVQAALFYLHAANVEAVRKHLLEKGLDDGGRFTGETGPDPFPRSGRVFSVTYPNHMPAGEFRVHDPDGYVLLVGQIG